MTPCQLPGCVAPIVRLEDGLLVDFDRPSALSCWADEDLLEEEEPLALQRWLDLNA